MKQIVKKTATFADVLVAVERQYPSYETDASIRTEIQNLPMLPNNLKAVCISELLADWDHWLGRLTPESYGNNKVPLWLWLRCLVTSRMSARQRRNTMPEFSPMRICGCFYWSWFSRRTGTPTSMLNPLGAAALVTVAVAIKDLDPLAKASPYQRSLHEQSPEPVGFTRIGEEERRDGEAIALLLLQRREGRPSSCP